MKKIKLGALVLGLMATLALSACGNKYADPIDVPSTISYDTLKLMAEEPKYEPKNYSITTSDYSYDSSVRLINSYDSILGYDIDGSLKNVATGYAISSLIPSNDLYSNGQFEGQNNYYYSSSLPIVLFTISRDDLNPELRIIDSYGNYLFTGSFGTSYYVESVNKKYVDDIMFISLNITGVTSGSLTKREFYYRYDVTNNNIPVERISAEDYKNSIKYSSSYSANQTLGYDDGLVTMYSKDATIMGYVHADGDSYYIYNEKKEFLNSFNPSFSLSTTIEISVPC